MKQLNKTLTLATNFKNWYSNNTAAAYDSSNNDFYYDVLYELLIIQNGVCAYTEYRLIAEDKLQQIKKLINKGKPKKEDRVDTPAHLEHFDKLKKKVSGWNWDNFFAVFDHINTTKNKLEDKHGLYPILKPDNPDYLPNKYLCYDKNLHLFYPNLSLNELEKDTVKKMILVLGINNDFIKMKREEYLKPIKIRESYLNVTQTINQFYTAYNML